MRAMVLAGGKSTRLYPLTLSVPKPNVPVAGEPNVAHVLRYLQSYSITDIAMNVHYLADQVTSTFGDGSAYGVKLTYLHEKELMGSAGALKAMEHYFDDTFVVVGCDDLTDMNLDTLVDFHIRRRALASIALVHAEDVEQYGVVIVEENGRIRNFQEKPLKGTESSHLVNTGVYIFEPAIFKHIPENQFFDFGKNVFPNILAAREPFFALEMRDAYWCDIGTPSEYRRANFDVVSQRVHLPEVQASRIAGDAELADSVVIEGPVHVGHRTKIAKGARIAGPSVIGDDCTIGEEAFLERTILWDGVNVGAKARLVDVIAGAGYRVAGGVHLNDTIVAPEPAAGSSVT